MKPVKTKPRFRCDHCAFVATQPTVQKHEIICWRNPDRWCDYCRNTGYTTEVYGDLIREGDGGLSQEVPCPYCSQFRSSEDMPDGLEHLNG